MFASAVISLILNGAVYYRMRGKLRERTDMETPEKEQISEYRMMLIKHTAIYPVRDISLDALSVLTWLADRLLYLHPPHCHRPLCPIRAIWRVRLWVRG